MATITYGEGHKSSITRYSLQELNNIARWAVKRNAPKGSRLKAAEVAVASNREPWLEVRYSTKEGLENVTTVAI